MALSTTIRAAISAALTSALDHGTVSFPMSVDAGVSLANGTSANQANMIFADQRTLAASASEDLDLAGGLTGPLGNTLTFAKIKAVVVKAASANTNDVILSRPASNGVPLFNAGSDAINVKPGGVFMWVAPGAGVTVTAGTGDLVSFSNSGAGTGVTFDVVIIGTDA